MSTGLFYIVIFACILVGIILAIGLIGFMMGGDFNKKYANKIMRARILAQFIAVILIVVFVLVARR